MELYTVHVALGNSVVFLVYVLVTVVIIYANYVTMSPNLTGVFSHGYFPLAKLYVSGLFRILPSS